ncbi:uncharacterized protein MONOS_12533 [Monocercomonoides exilis]|uniref:uncharacterized protein n=1 Tax=Monocercomonoides exilis TaxID=2049356 RepID=UPI00355A1550|nr:hypothetical protein MONOS_12533 [Monocercomonoides exilis]
MCVWDHHWALCGEECDACAQEQREWRGGVFLAMTDNGIVDLVGCNVESAAGEEALQAPFMTMSRGVATLEDVKMEGMRFGGRGAIQGSAPGSGCGIVVKESNMSGMEVSEGNGSVVCFALGGGGEVVVSSCKVSGCGCESGCGGSVCVKMEGGGRVVVNGTERTQFELCRAGAGRDGAGGLGGAVFVETNRGGGEVWMGNTTFERCTAKKGAKVFVSISDLSSVIVRERFLVEHTAEDAEALSGFDRDRSGETGYVPLIVFVEQWGGRAFVAGEEGAEHYRCGFSFYACSTIEKAVEHRFASGKRRMVLEAPFVFDHEMVFSGEEYEMEGRQAQNEIRIDGASGAGQSGLLCVQTGVAVSDVVFVLPMSIGGRNVFVRCESHELRLVRCTLRPVGSLSSSPSFATGVAACTLLREEQRKMTYSFVCVVDSALRVESLVVDRGMCLQRSSVIGCSGVCDVELRGCVFEGVEKTEGSGACVEGEVRGEGTKREGRIVVEGCTFRRCKTAEQESSGGGVCAALWGKSTLVVNGTGVFEECKASEGSSGKGRGGGVMIRVNDEESWLGICRGVVFSREKPNWARWGRDVFVDCGSGVLLEGKISAESVGFADPLEMADDALGVCGVENGSAVPVIPLFVYLLVQPGRIRVDGRSGADHVFCGFELFECLTVDYCFEERSSVNASRIEVCSEARLGAEMKVESFGLSICSQSEAEARVDVEDEGARSEEGLISCSFPFSASGTLFWLARRLQVGREWLILSRESLRLSKCRVGFGFEDGESAGFGAICVVGGRMELRECVLSVEAELEKKAAVDVRGYSTVNVAGCVFEGWRNGRGDGGSMAIRSEGGEAGSAEIRNTTINGCSCVGGCELKGGGMSIAISEEDEFVVHNASLNRCSVPSGSSEACGAERGVGGGVFVEAVGGAAGFALREMKFSGCDGWKGKNVFVCGRELDRIVDKEHLNWTMSSDELEQLEWMSGWEMSSTGTRLAIPLAVYLWGNFSMEGYVDGAGGEDFSGCGQPVIPCKTIDGMVSMRLGRATATSKCVIGVLGESAARGAVELSKAGSYKLCGCGERRRIVVEDGGGGAQRGYFGCHVECRFEKAEFAVPDELSGQLRSLFECEGGKVGLRDCSVKARETGKGVSFSVISAESGVVEVAGLEVEGMEFGERSMVVMDGSGGGDVSGRMDDVELDGVSSKSGGGLAELRSCSCVVCEGWMVRSVEQVNGSVVHAEGVKELRIRSSEFRRCWREIRNGSVLVGWVCGGEEAEVWNCTMEEDGTRDGFCGGSVCCGVGEGGMLRFDESVVRKSETMVRNGVGGGLYVEFLSRELIYSVKSVEFEENVAWRGRNAYVVCEGARAMIQYELWKGTTTEETIEENDLWVYEKGSTGEGETMRKHLFPGNEMIVYVDSSGREGEGCGAYDDYDFCADLVSGYAVMKGAQHILHIAKDAALNGELMRTRDPLTIRGGKEKSVMRVGEGGHLVQKSEVESNTLVLSQLVVELGSGGGVEAELVLVEKGRVAVDNCAFGEESVGRGSGMWIIGMSGGRCMMDNVSVRNMEFEEGCGVVRVDGGTAEIGCSNLTACRTDGKGLVVGGEGGDVKISGCAFLGCEAGGGSAVRLCGGSSGRIGNGSVFEECLTQGGEGGAMKWELSGGGRCTMDGAGVRRNCAEGEEGRGGGVFVGIVEEGDTNFEFGSGVEFGGNRAQAGKDVNVMCSSLNSSIQASRFLFELRSGEGVWRCGMEGTDESMFEGVDVDLMLFLVEYKGESVYVWSEGMDVAGCGKQEVECRSFWRGLKNLRDGAGEKKVFVKGWTSIADCHDVSGLRISARDDGETSELRVGSKLPSGSGGGVLSSTASLAIVSQVFVLPSSFDGEVGCVISSRTREGLLVLSGCSFSLVEEGGNGEAGEGRLGYELVCVEGGSAAMEDCRIRWMEFEKSPLLFVEARVSLENCVLDGVLSGGGGGGAARAVCGEEGVFVVEGGEFGGCENVGAGSKGGVFFVDSRTSRMAEPFGLREIRVEGTNKAEIGKQLFIASDDLNKTVREETMGCVVGLSGMDENSCVGWEERFGVIDVRVFLVKAVLEVVAVSARGHNILGCGKDEMPCETVWEGMRHLDLGSREKALVIVDEALVCDDLDVSDVKIGGMGSEEDEKHLSRIRFEKSGEGCGEGGGEMGNGVMRNKGVFEMWMMEVGAGEGFGNAEGALIVSERGRVVVRESVFEGRGEDGERNEFALVEIAGGELVMENVEMKGVCVRGCVVRMREGSEMRAEGLSVGMARLYDGSVVEVGEGLGAENGKKGTVVEMNKSEIVDVKREVGRGCVVDERGEGLRGSVSVRMVGVRMHTCQSLGSLEGGGVFGELRGEGQMEVENCWMVQCSSNGAAGRGGGVYVRTVLKTELKLVVKEGEFDGNVALYGRNVFVECFCIEEQINETQFRLKLSGMVQEHLFSGVDRQEHTEVVDLMKFIRVYEASTIFVGSRGEKKGKNARQCGSLEEPCLSLEYGWGHAVSDFECRLLVMGECELNGDVDLREVVVKPVERDVGRVCVCVGGCGGGGGGGGGKGGAGARSGLMEMSGSVEVERVAFELGSVERGSYEWLMRVQEGTLELEKCSFLSGGSEKSGFVKRIVCCLGGVLVGKNVEMRMLDVVCGVVCKEGMVEVEGMKASNMDCGECLMRCEDSFVGIDGMSANGICVGKGPLVEVDGKGKDKTGERNGKSWMRGVRAENMSSGGETAVLKVERWMDGEVTNCSFGRCDGEGTGGRLMVLGGCKGVVVSTCVLDGRGRGEGDERRGGNWEGEVCKWNGSAGEFEGCEAVVKDTTVSNSGEGGLSVCGGSVEIEDGKFENNNPSIEGYPSMRRNILCSDNGVLNVMSLKGGDGWERNTSLWILNEGCELGGIASERASSLFIPVVEEARNETASDGRTIITLSGRLLLPCNVWLKLSFRNGREEVVESYGVGERESVSENEIVAAVSSGQMAIVGAETEVSVSLLFGNLDTPSATDSFILKNRSDPKATEDERIVEGGKKERSIWPIIVIVLVVILLIVLIVAVAFIIRWKKAKDENNDLREIVNDNIRKDPKAFEMVTMEMSPEEQWRRAEREAEKKNEERIKRRVYAKSLQHSESSEHLLSENGSTEYIFGSDSDKIPQWILEKVDEKEEEEETNKRTPSPSVSSTSTTDSDSSFVRVEDLCPTTSSMSNLVDAMACSSPHEKLIVDLRDSLFMLLHGRNKTKEMAIGCLQEREQTAAQILFWVANGALHSFDECEVPLQSLTNLSPHIVLFSEHMVICIAKHSDFSSDDFESSSISSSSVFTSASDDDDRDSLLSSAFEDEDDFKKECLRWKAPELLNGRKKHATKKTVVLSVGMMMWECLTLDVPFGKYEAEVAGQKMVNGERPCGGESEASGMHEMVKGCWKADSGERPTLPGVTRKCFEFFPAGATVVTMSDAVGCEGGSEDAANSEEMESMIGESELSVVRGSPAQ